MAKELAVTDTGLESLLKHKNTGNNCRPRARMEY
jgi:hypothetical protein